MRTLVLLWLLPAAAFWIWHAMSLGDVIFPREFHDALFTLYGSLLGIAPDELPAMIRHAFLVDGSIVLAILAWRERARMPRLRLPFRARTMPAGRGRPAE